MSRISLFVLIFAFSTTVSRAADLYVGDYSGGNGSINYFDAGSGAFILNTTVPGNAMSFPGQIAIGPNGNLYIADGAGYVDVFNATTGAYLTQFGSGYFNSPSGLVFSSTGDLLVSDSSAGNGFIDEFDQGGNYIGQIVSPGAGGLSFPNALTIGPDGNLYIADEDGDIYQYNFSTTTLSEFATNSTANFNLVFGPDGNLYVMSADNGGTVDVFDGTTGAFIGPFGNTSTALGGGPLGMAFGADGNLYVADENGVDIVDGTTGNVTGNFAPSGGDVVNPEFLTFQTSSAPEPSTFLFGALGLIAIGSLYKRKN